MSLRDILAHIKEIYDTDISHTVLSQITDQIIPDLKAWQTRPLESLYCIVWLDAMHYKVKVDGKVQYKVLYNVLGINKERKKYSVCIFLRLKELIFGYRY
jgi:putative transposase